MDKTCCIFCAEACLCGAPHFPRALFVSLFGDGGEPYAKSIPPYDSPCNEAEVLRGLKIVRRAAIAIYQGVRYEVPFIPLGLLAVGVRYEVNGVEWQPQSPCALAPTKTPPIAALPVVRSCASPVAAGATLSASEVIAAWRDCAAESEAVKRQVIVDFCAAYNGEKQLRIKLLSRLLQTHQIGAIAAYIVLLSQVGEAYREEKIFVYEDARSHIEIPVTEDGFYALARIARYGPSPLYDSFIDLITVRLGRERALDLVWCDLIRSDTTSATCAKVLKLFGYMFVKEEDNAD